MTTNRKIFFIVFLLEIILFGLTNSFTIGAQNFERFSNKEGFNQNSISTIEQDLYGNIWFGTPNGLIKYDGYEFKTYNTQSKTNGNIISNVITHLYNDQNGVLWIGTNLGLTIYIPWIEKFYTIPLDRKVYVNRITSDQNGRIWFCGNNQLYVCELLDAEKGKIKRSDNFLSSQLKNVQLNDFSFKDQNSLILATTMGLKKLTFNKDAPYNTLKESTLSNFDAFQNKNIKSILNKNNIFWLGTTQGVFKVTLDANRVHELMAFGNLENVESPKLPLFINTVFEDHSGAVWVGTTANGLYKYDEKENNFEHFTYDSKNESGLSSLYIRALYQDDFNVLWIGTAQGGINKLDLTQKTFINYSHNPYDDESISDNLITSILEDSKGNLWISGYNKPLVRATHIVTDKTVDKLKFENLEKHIKLADNDIVRCIYEDRKGYIWLGTEYNIIVYNPKTNVFKKVFLKNSEKGTENSTRCIYQIDDNHILLAGNKVSISENPWNEIKNSEIPLLNIKSDINLTPKRAQCILKDTNNTLWIGTSNGLLHTTFNGEDILINQKYTDNKNDKITLSTNDIFSLHKDNKNHLWVGTFGGGINKMYLDEQGSPARIEYFRKNDILPDDAIYGILQQDESHLWLSTDMGLVKFDIEKNITDLYDVRDGLAQNNFREAAYFKGNSGYFYFGGLNGLTIFNPENIIPNIQPPNILISDLLINNKSIKIGEKLNNKVVLKKSISETENISVSQNQQIISFNVIVQHTTTPSKNKLAYKLEGFNDEWVENESGKATITYTNLSAGNYVFKVKAANGDHIWSETSKSLNLKILPPWYNTWWSYLIFIITTLTITIGIIIYFVNHERLKQRLKYETLDKERTEQVNQGKFRYFTNLSHEFRTPLTLISGPIEYMLNHNSDPNNNKYLAIVQKNTERLLSLVNQLITFRQAEEGRVYLNLVKYTLGDFIYPITEAFENYAIEKNINFFYKVNNANEDIVIDVQKFERIIFNLLSNSFKNTPSQGDISIEAKINFNSGQKTIQIDVIDTGRGIPKENIENIFERFYQLGNNQGNISGGGIGLAFCKSLVNLLEGSITATSNPGVETRFSVIIPLKDLDDYEYEKPKGSNQSFIKNWIPLSPNIIDSENKLYNSENEKQHSILVVENEVDVQNFLKSTLSEKYNITTANNGKEALEKIKMGEPDLIVSDVMMPEMDGYELCKKLKSAPDTCHLPILLLTALGDNENLIKGLEFGADEYISKPFSLKHLQLRIEKLIQYKIQIKEYFSKNSQLPKGKKEIKISKRDEDFLKKTIDIIDKNLSDSNFGVGELSKEMGFSTTHFYRRLKQLTGQVPSIYIKNFRLQRAAELLKNNEGHNVSEVMYQIGIESNSHFSTSFKKLYGLSPSEYIKDEKSSS
ncbi:hybrid sensor histidine kinase/response regulator transcription factor [Flavivirga jejuensis]|uniref:histidine kinase n=1 Tax=Flavivirga jejuensis TaxID=870487 RepID=A0ABT8WVG7_9FLAO|nr:hybrid sensor histidine kinase/response regulator transcription factor [Flavivirga jejuensis]MDO5976872.1 two-component regulator propeller domain-containing protein [Flavivirga jejuensis]